MKYETLITEIRNAEGAIERYAKYYHAREREKKRTDEEPAYKSRYKELRELLQKEVNKYEGNA